MIYCNVLQQAATALPQVALPCIGSHQVCYRCPQRWATSPQRACLECRRHSDRVQEADWLFLPICHAKEQDQPRPPAEKHLAPQTNAKSFWPGIEQPWEELCLLAFQELRIIQGTFKANNLKVISELNGNSSTRTVERIREDMKRHLIFEHKIFAYFQEWN